MPLVVLVCVPLPSQPRFEESEDITTACQVVDANVALRSSAVRGANHLPERRHIGSKTQP